jgi:ubiquinone/menaquinone biosynthesis C-methylase UbiE
MKRIPEPEELMADAAQARAYASVDFAEARELFLDHFTWLQPGGFGGHALDLGCGPADIPIALAELNPAARIDALDGADAMLAHARSALQSRPAVAARMRLVCDLLPSNQLREQAYDAVLSNSLLHHLLDPGTLWDAVKRYARPGAAVCVMDLLRPADPAAVDELVTRHAADAPELLRRDFRNSLFAAYETAEVESQLAAAGLDGLQVRRISDRHLLVSGFAPA